MPTVNIIYALEDTDRFDKDRLMAHSVDAPLKISRGEQVEIDAGLWSQVTEVLTVPDWYLPLLGTPRAFYDSSIGEIRIEDNG